MAQDLNQRIAQFKNMAEADPNNELGHFSLGKAYLEAGQFQEAVASISRALQIDPTLSKAYQILGEAYEKSGDAPRAIQTYTKGVSIADEQGDRVPRDGMASALKKLGAAVPEFRKTENARDTGGKEASPAGFRCARCGQPEGRLDKAPFRGELGQRIFENTCRTCFREWIGMGTKVINELGLVLNRPECQVTYDQYMVEFLQLEDT